MTDSPSEQPTEPPETLDRTGPADAVQGIEVEDQRDEQDGLPGDS